MKEWFKDTLELLKAGFDGFCIGAKFGKNHPDTVIKFMKEWKNSPKEKRVEVCNDYFKRIEED